MMSKVSTVVIEDQPIVWDYIRSCLEDFCEIEAFCTSTTDATKAIKQIQPKFVWLDCYLGELNDCGQGIKNSGLEIAHWLKSHYLETKIFLFTASNEIGVLKKAERLGIEGIALSGKYISDKEVVKQGVAKVLAGETWISPQILESLELQDFNQITVFEFSVLSSLVVGKNTAQIAEELSTTRKMINNAVYRAQQKLFIDPALSREMFLDMFKEKLVSSFGASHYYNLTEVATINTIIESCLSPVMDEIKQGNLAKKRIKV